MQAKITLTASLERSMVYRLLRSAAGMFPLTLQGMLTLGIVAFALRQYAYGALDLVVFALGICALAILIFSLFCTILSGVLIQRRIHRELEEQEAATGSILLESGFPNESGFHLPALNYFPLIKLNWQVVYPDKLTTRIRVTDSEAGHTVLSEEILPERRCLSDKVTRQFTVADVLGFCRYSWRQSQSRECYCLPQVNTLKQLPLLRSMTAEDGIPDPTGSPEGDRMEIRRYAPGDSVRDIMWKAYARSGQLNVRLAEKSVFHSQRTLAYLLSSKNDEAAAATARLALQRGVLGDDWAFGADGTQGVTSELPTALRAIAASRPLASPHAYGLDSFMQSQATSGSSHCILFTAARRTHSLALLKATLQRYPGKFSVVLATDQLTETIKPARWRRWLLTAGSSPSLALDDRVSKAELLGLLTEIGQFVESILVIERHTGRCFDRNLKKV